MGEFNVLIPKLGESIQEGTITKLFVKEGDIINEDDVLFELATDKVDSEIPSPVSGKVKEIRCTENETYPVGQIVIIISMGETEIAQKKESVDKGEAKNQTKEDITGKEEYKSEKENESFVLSSEQNTNQDRFFSPLVKNIAEKEGIPLKELNSLKGSGLGGRVQKKDILNYIKEQQVKPRENVIKKEILPESKQPEKVSESAENKFKISVSVGADDTIIKMDRVRKLIAQHMIMSKDVSAHVTSVVEVDVTNLVLWRNKIKDLFQQKYNEKITFLPIITEAVAKALDEFRVINASVDGENIILRKHINIGIAVAKEDDTLIVPVIKDADSKNILGITREINGFGTSAKNNKILPDQLQGGTFSITNFGSFGNIIGTPIINQPQVAILAVGLIEKKPSVIETPTGDAIAVRHKMFLSLSYDHRVIDGMLGGKFLRRIADLLEQFDLKREI